MGVVSKKITMRKNVIVVTGSSLAAYGSFHGGVGCGSGEARSVSDTKFQKSMSCHMGLSGERQNRVYGVQNRCFLRKKRQILGISRVLRGVLTDIH